MSNYIKNIFVQILDIKLKEIEKEFNDFISGCSSCAKLDFCKDVRLIKKELIDIKSDINDLNRSFYENTIRNIFKSMDRIKETCPEYFVSKIEFKTISNTTDLSILYIDHNTVKSTTLNKMLSRYFTNIEMSYDYKKGLKLLSKNHYDILLVDLNSLNMSHTSLVDFLNRIKNLSLHIYIFCNSCQTCKEKSCPELLVKEKVRYFELPFNFIEVLDSISRDFGVDIAFSKSNFFL